MPNRIVMDYPSIFSLERASSASLVHVGLFCRAASSLGFMYEGKPSPALIRAKVVEIFTLNPKLYAEAPMNQT